MSIRSTLVVLAIFVLAVAIVVDYYHMVGACVTAIYWVPVLAAFLIAWGGLGKKQAVLVALAVVIVALLFSSLPAQFAPVDFLRKLSTGRDLSLNEPAPAGIVNMMKRFETAVARAPFCRPR